MAESVTKRDVAVDFVKVIATILVLNSHMQICYANHSSLATGGGIGDALFFFVSGFTLFIGKKTSFIDWYKRRIGRIYPTVIAMGLVSSLVFNRNFSFIDIMTANKYWFLQCILICYLILYPIIRYNIKLSVCLPISIILMVIAFFSLFDFHGQLFYGVDNLFRWIVYLTIMLVGGGISHLSKKIHYNWWAIPGFIISVVLWYGINFLSKGNSFQILSYLPLLGICFFMYQIGKAPLIGKYFDTKILGNILFVIGNLCLESYLIQKYIFTDSLNNIFPFNIPIIMLAVLLAAYLLHILSSIVSQIFNSTPFDWKSLLLYKK